MLGIMMLGFSACQDGDWEAPDFSKGAPYGNNQLTEDNIITIAELKQRYPKYAENYTTSEITEDCKLRVRVTGNDIQGNLYNAIAVQEDESGDALIIAITGSDLFAYMAVGQELLVDLKGLYIGAYGKQPQIGTPYAKDENSDAYHEADFLLSVAERQGLFEVGCGLVIMQQQAAPISRAAGAQDQGTCEKNQCFFEGVWLSLFQPFQIFFGLFPKYDAVHN